MGALMRSTDWSQPSSVRWPTGRRACAPRSASCSNRALRWSWRGARSSVSSTTIATGPLLGTKHPAALGAPGAEIFPEVWSVVGPEFERVRRRRSLCGRRLAAPARSQRLPGELLVHAVCTAHPGRDGGVGGCWRWLRKRPGASKASVGSRRCASCARRAADATTPEQACVNAAQVFGANPDRRALRAHLSAGPRRDGSTARVRHRHPARIIRPTSRPFDLASGTTTSGRWQRSFGSGKAMVRSDLQRRLGRAARRPVREHTHTAILLPLSRPGLDHPYGVLVAGVSPRRALDDRYRDFFELAADHIATAISNAVALEEARRRADALAEIDRAKTAFFSNVSHEFRTPLTLMLGPAEELLAERHGQLTATQRAQVEILHRNAGAC